MRDELCLGVAELIDAATEPTDPAATAGGTLEASESGSASPFEALADLGKVAYELKRESIAAAHGWHPVTVDRIVNAIREERAGQAATVRQVHAADLSEVLGHSFPEREYVLEPVLCLGSLNMLVAWRGIGKTHAALGIAYAAASGGRFLGWEASRPFRVLYLDGEMPGESLQERLASIVAASDKEPPRDYLRIVTIDMQGGVMPDLAEPNGQAALMDECESAELIIVDNLSCLVRGDGRENEASGWLAVAQWALALRAKGKAVLFIHHAGKDGNQRGTSKREDLLDVSIALKRPPDYSPEQGARFELHFIKARHLIGDAAKPIEARLDQDEHGRQTWTFKPVEACTDDLVAELAELGMSQADIAAELGVNKSTVCRSFKKLKDAGRLKTSTKDATRRATHAQPTQRRADVNN